MAKDLTAYILDLELPFPASWWPPAPGWWLLALALLVGFILTIRWRRRRLAGRRFALRELQRLTAAFNQNGDASQFAMRVSILLRRVALARDTRDHVAGLIGDDWLNYLDLRGKTNAFSRGPGRVLANLPYSNDGHLDAKALRQLVEVWIRKNT